MRSRDPSLTFQRLEDFCTFVEFGSVPQAAVSSEWRNLSSLRIYGVWRGVSVMRS